MQSYLQRFLITLSLVIATGAINRSAAQVTIAENDTTVCQGYTTTLHASNPAGVPVGTALVVDDLYSSAVSIGFPFVFYGTTYSRCVISTNGFISFNIGNAGSFSNWYVGRSGTAAGPGGPVPGNTDVLNSIMTHFADIYPTTTQGLISYTYAGNSPNRRFIVTYCDVELYSCFDSLTSFQTVLFEGSNKIEMHIRKKPVCINYPTSAPGGAIQGLQNELGGFADVVPGRNGTVWTAARDSRRFTPNGPNAYTIDSIPYAPVALAGDADYTWYTLPNTILARTKDLAVAPSRSTTYYVRQVYCSDTSVDSIRIIVGGNPQIQSVTPHNPSYCGAADGSLDLNGLDPNVNYDVHYSKGGLPQPGFQVGSSAAGVVTIPNLTAGIYNFISVSVGVCNAGNVVGPFTLFNPPIPVDFTTKLLPSCGGIDTIAFTNTTPTPGTINYTWDFGDGGTSSVKDPVHVYTAQNSYSVLITADNGICRDSLRKSVDTRHPLVAAFNVDYDTACISQVLNFKDTSVYTAGTASPTYFWDFGDGTTGSGNAPIHAYTQSGLYHVRMIINDFVPCADTAYRDIFVNVTPTTTLLSNDSMLCEGRGSVFTASFAGVKPTSYEWTFSDGSVIENTNPVSHAFDSSGTYSITIATHYAFCPDTFFTSNVTINPYPNVNLGPDTALCPGSEAIVIRDLAATNGTAQYTWNTGATTSAINVNMDGVYSVTKTVNGCAVADSVTVFKKCYLDIPNVFSPNGDGSNDYFLPRQLLSRGVTAFKMTIFNRWGQVVFEATSLNGRGWDGTFNSAIQPQGAYVYMIDVSFEDGRSEHYNGNVTLIR